MNYETVKITELESNIFQISLNRPDKLNALNAQTSIDLPAAMEECMCNPDCRVIVLGGEGGRSFIAGADLEEYQNMGPLQLREEFHDGYIRFLKLIDDSEKPVIAAVKGFAFGGGNIVTMHCDMVFATDDSKFAQQEVAVGLMGGFCRMASLIGMRKAKEICLTGQILSAQEAVEIGLINKCLPREDFDEYVLAFCRKLAAKPATTMKAMRIVKNVYESAPLQVAMQYEFELTNVLFSSSGAHEGINAFVDRRKPSYSEEKYWPNAGT